MIKKLIEESYKIGMTQEKIEITQFAKFIRDLNPHNVLEIGCKLGGTFNILCNLSTGKKISVDLPGGIHGGWMMKDHPYMGDTYVLRNHFFKSNYHQVHMITGNSHEDNTLKQVKECLDNDRVDLLFIDGDHTYEGVKQDYYDYSQFVKPGGWIAFHDINDTSHHREINVYVGKLWNELEGNKKEFNTKKHWAGIGVIQI
jgi:cephalosporin hydroxylase